MLRKGQGLSPLPLRGAHFGSQASCQFVGASIKFLQTAGTETKPTCRGKTFCFPKGLGKYHRTPGHFPLSKGGWGGHMVVCTKQSVHQSQVPPRETECFGRLFFQEKQCCSDKMEVEPMCTVSCIQNMG